MFTDFGERNVQDFIGEERVDGRDESVEQD